LIDHGLPLQEALSCLKNPPINGSDLFSQTENMNTHAAVDLFLKIVKGA
jgi:hypothetical protein